MAIHISEFSGHDGNNNFIGINKAGLERIKDIILEYENKVQKTLEQMLTGVSQDNAFKGEDFRQAVTKFVTAVKDEGKEWTSQIQRYCDTIDVMLKKMQAAETQLSSGLDQSTRAVSSQTTGYSYGGGSSSAS